MKYFFIIGLLFLTINVFAQSENDTNNSRKTDSLNLILKSAKDTRKAEIYIDLAYEYLTCEPYKALFYTDSALAIIPINDKVITGKVYKIKGLINTESSHYKEALKFYFKALDYYKDSDNKNETAVIYNNISRVYMELDLLDKAKKFFLKANKIFKETGNLDSEYITSTNIALILKAKGETEEAKDVFLRLIERIDEHPKSAISVYNGIADILKIENKYEEALTFYFKAYDAAKIYNDKRFLPIIYFNIGNISLVSA